MRAWVHCVATMAAGLPILGCADGLVYGERTSFSVASLRLNDDPAQPVAVKLGFNRDVVLVAPPIGGSVVEKDVSLGGEAVSQFSTFTVKSTTPFVPDPRKGKDDQVQLLGVQSRFASGEAAIAIAETPKVVAAFMGVVVGPVLTQACATEIQTARLGAIQNAIGSLDGNRARALALSPPTPYNKYEEASQEILPIVDPDDQRTVNETRAKKVLVAWLQSVVCEDYGDWESALGIQR